MLCLLSPAKTQDFTDKVSANTATQPLLKTDIKLLVDELKQYSKAKIAKLMQLSDKLAELNYQRFQAFNPATYHPQNAKPTVFAFRGDAYKGLAVNELDKNAIDYLQNHLVILSGLYGALRPLDLIQPYRLEMKTPLKNPRGHDLYAFWQDQLPATINQLLAKQKNKTLVNLASNEYFKAVGAQKIKAERVDVVFKEKKNSEYKVIGIHAKRARGLMVRFIAQEKIDNIEDIKSFTLEKYRFNPKLSSEKILTFTR